MLALSSSVSRIEHFGKFGSFSMCLYEYQTFQYYIAVILLQRTKTVLALRQFNDKQQFITVFHFHLGHLVAILC